MIRLTLKSGQDGFTLFEAMVALAILVLGLGAFYRSVAGGASNSVRVARASTALQIAEARLAAEGVEQRLIVGKREGDDAAGRHWAVTVLRYAEERDFGAGSGPVAYLVTADVSEPAGRNGARPSVSISTLKIAAAP